MFMACTLFAVNNADALEKICYDLKTKRRRNETAGRMSGDGLTVLLRHQQRLKSHTSSFWYMFPQIARNNIRVHSAQEALKSVCSHTPRNAYIVNVDFCQVSR